MQWECNRNRMAAARCIQHRLFLTSRGRVGYLLKMQIWLQCASPPEVRVSTPRTEESTETTDERSAGQVSVLSRACVRFRSVEGVRASISLSETHLATRLEARWASRRTKSKKESRDFWDWLTHACSSASSTGSSRTRITVRMPGAGRSRADSYERMGHTRPDCVCVCVCVCV